MSLSGAMNSAVTGIDAQSTALSAISDNISNSQTNGYKAVNTQFSTLITESNALVHDSGGVTSRPLYTNDVQGNPQSTGVDTNVAISGSGMFAVGQKLGTSSTNALPTFAPDPLYTREGDFTTDQQGYMVNGSGYVLMGFAINPTTGVVEKNQLVPIQLNDLKSNPQPTTSITYSANLPTTPASNLNTGSTTAQATGQTMNLGTSTPTFGDGQTITVTTTAVDGTTSTKTFEFIDTSIVPPTTPGAGNIAINFNSATDSSATQVGDLRAALTAAGIQSSADSSGNITIGSSTNALPPRVTGVSTTIPGATLTADTVAANIQFSSTPVNFFDAQGAAHPLNVTWTQVAGTNNTYEVSYSSTDPAIAGITPSTPTIVTFNVADDPATGAKAGSILSVNGVAGAVGTAAGVPLDITLGGNAPTTQNVNFSLGNFGVAQQTTMFTGSDVNFVSAPQDGLPPGSFRSLSIDKSGNITLNYDNGATKTEYQIPLVQFSNFNALQPESGNAYSKTVAAGVPSVNSPGDNGTGQIMADTVEGSNVDIATEFTMLIQTQRAYEANTKVVTSVNQLLQETNNLVQ